VLAEVVLAGSPPRPRDGSEADVYDDGLLCDGVVFPIPPGGYPCPRPLDRPVNVVGEGPRLRGFRCRHRRRPAFLKARRTRYWSTPIPRDTGTPPTTVDP
jgi:hypothetical protein